jgi:hypothetical protein
VPTYEYRCDANDRLIEVRHKMAETLRSWGELCGRAGISPGRTDSQTPVHKLISAGFVSTRAREPACAADACEAPVCGASPCGGDGCAGGEF